MTFRHQIESSTAKNLPVPLHVKLSRYASSIRNRVWGSIDRPLRQIASTTRFGALLYYTVFSSAFRRECYCTLAGRVRHDRELLAENRSYPLLRRNIHRIEKGLIMDPRRDLFAVGYISETVDIYSKLRQHDTALPGGDNPELTWARDVLREYFNVTTEMPETSKARLKFEKTDIDCSSRSAVLIPYRRTLSMPPTVNYSDFLALCRRRRSVRWFENRPVPRELIDKAMLAAAEAPSACNRQPFSFRFFDSTEAITEVSKIPMGTAGFEHNFPVFGVIVGELSNYTDERDRHLIYIDGALAAMSFCLAAESQGLSSCLINWPDIEARERRMAQLLSLRPDQRPVMCLAVGYPDHSGLVPRSMKKPLDLLRSYNEVQLTSAL